MPSLTLPRMAEEAESGQTLLLMHHYKAPHDYFENAERYESYRRGRRSGTETLGKDSDGSLATRNNDELIPHIGTSLGTVTLAALLRGLPKISAGIPREHDPVDYTVERAFLCLQRLSQEISQVRKGNRRQPGRLSST